VQPGQKWVDFSGTIDGREYGLAILNDSKYGFDVREGCRGHAGLRGSAEPGGVMRLTLLRSPAYAHHDPARYESSAPYAIIDQGWQTVRVRLVPHAGPMADARVPRRAWELNEPPLIHVESAHPGSRPGKGSLLAVEAENVLLTVLKKSEDGDDLIVRGYEADGKAVTTEISLPFCGKRFTVSFGPHEIKTLRVNPRDWTMKDVDLLET
jgi:alpha-mannosidase